MVLVMLSSDADVLDVRGTVSRWEIGLARRLVVEHLQRCLEKWRG